MWIRAAYWIGKPKPGEEHVFRSIVDDEFLPAIRCFPGVGDVRALWPQRRDENAPSIYCEVLIEFATEEDMRLMSVSPERFSLHPRLFAAAALFDGEFTHIDHRIGA